VQAIISEFESLIKPVRCLKLWEFCRSLTTNRQEDVDPAPPFPEVWVQFLEWPGTLSDAQLAAWGA
jgi:inhibitor of KinA sporulation pathway (predicted exonuclease)